MIDTSLFKTITYVKNVLKCSKKKIDKRTVERRVNCGWTIQQRSVRSKREVGPGPDRQPELKQGAGEREGFENEHCFEDS